MLALLLFCHNSGIFPELQCLSATSVFPQRVFRPPHSLQCNKVIIMVYY